MLFYTVPTINPFIRPLRSRLPELEAIYAAAASPEEASEAILAFATSAEIAAFVAKLVGSRRTTRTPTSRLL